jgi:hypothetical protein
VDPSVGKDDVGRRKFLTLPGLEIRPLGRAARSQSTYSTIFELKLETNNFVCAFIISHTTSEVGMSSD